MQRGSAGRDREDCALEAVPSPLELLLRLQAALVGLLWPQMCLDLATVPPLFVERRTHRKSLGAQRPLERHWCDGMVLTDWVRISSASTDIDDTGRGDTPPLFLTDGTLLVVSMAGTCTVIHFPSALRSAV